MTDDLLKKVREKFEWYRMTLPHKHREVFDHILEKSDGKELSLASMAGNHTTAIIMTELLDMEVRLEKLEKHNRNND